MENIFVGTTTFFSSRKWNCFNHYEKQIDIIIDIWLWIAHAVCLILIIKPLPILEL